MTRPGIPNEFVLSTTCFGGRLPAIDDQVFAAVAMGFRKLELGLSDAPPSMEALEDSRRETGMQIVSMVAGCRDPLNGGSTAIRLGSPASEVRERSLNSVRRHVRLARQWGCDTLVLSGHSIEGADYERRRHALEAELVTKGLTPDLRERIAAFVADVGRAGHAQIEHFCRALHHLMRETPDVHFAVQPGLHMDDLLGFDGMGWVLDDLEALGLRYWHDVGRVHLRERIGLGDQGRWLEAYGGRMAGIHMQDAADSEIEMPLGLGEVDFRLVAEYVPASALRVIALNPRHGRAEVLASVQFLMDHGF